MKHVLLWLLFIIGVLGLIYVIPGGLKRVLNCENPTLTVISYSMYPLLTRGDMILVKGVTLPEIKVGTVIVFNHQNGLAVHRVVSVYGQTIVTKGDANTTEDTPITFDDVIGRVPNLGKGLWKIPLIGRISLLGNTDTAEPAGESNPVQQFARYVWNPIGFSLLVVMPFILFFGSFAPDVIAVFNPAFKRKRLRARRLEKLRKRRSGAHAR